MEYKSVKAIDYKFDTESGIFEGFPSVFGVVDDGDPWTGVKDVVHPGSFRKTIDENFDRILVCYGHNPFSALPIGKPLDLEERPRDALPDKLLEAYPEATGGLWHRSRISDTTLGGDVATLLRDKVLKELSIGYDPIKVDFSDGGKIRHLKENRLWEYSVVPWAMNPAAWVTDAKGAIGYTKRPLADKDTSWDGPAQVKKASTLEALRAIHAWVDGNGKDEDGNPVKGDFKLPHHMGEAPYNTVWGGVKNAMGVLFGAMGGVDVPDSDRKGIYNHLGRHYGEFDEEPPEYKNYKSLGWSDEAILALCGVFPEGTDAAEYLERMVKELEAMQDSPPEPDAHILVLDPEDWGEIEQVEAALAKLDARRKELTPTVSANVLRHELDILSVELSMDAI